MFFSLEIFGEISVAIIFGFENPTFLAKQTNQPNDDGDDDVFVNLPNTLGAFCYFFTLRPNQVLWLKSSWFLQKPWLVLCKTVEHLITTVTILNI